MQVDEVHGYKRKSMNHKVGMNTVLHSFILSFCFSFSNLLFHHHNLCKQINTRTVCTASKCYIFLIDTINLSSEKSFLKKTCFIGTHDPLNYEAHQPTYIISKVFHNPRYC